MVFIDKRLITNSQISNNYIYAKIVPYDNFWTEFRYIHVPAWNKHVMGTSYTHKINNIWELSVFWILCYIVEQKSINYLIRLRQEYNNTKSINYVFASFIAQRVQQNKILCKYLGHFRSLLIINGMTVFCQSWL